LRIIAGQRRGKRLAGPTDRLIRPTADRLRESIFDILGSRVVGAGILDLFAGTGAMGLEALSRGAARACFVDVSAAAAALISRNLEACGFVDRARVIRCEAAKVFGRLAQDPPYDLVFLDPPYDCGLLAPALTGVVRASVLAPHALMVIEHAPAEALPALAGSWQCVDRRRYGKTLVSFVGVVL
jgi:16S rRNA (guanine966-N2)-methyltransferase